MERDGELVRDVQVLGIDFRPSRSFDKIIGTLNAVNDLHFRCDLFGVVDDDPPVLVLYRPGQGHYGWHRTPRRALCSSRLRCSCRRPTATRGATSRSRVSGPPNVRPAR
jgi:hypothetical protein